MPAATQVVFDALVICFEFIDLAYKQSGAILVHCGRGISRSSTIAIAYLMRVQKLTFAQAYVVVSERRPCACAAAVLTAVESNDGCGL